MPETKQFKSIGSNGSSKETSGSSGSESEPEIIEIEIKKEKFNKKIEKKLKNEQENFNNLISYFEENQPKILEKIKEEYNLSEGEKLTFDEIYYFFLEHSDYSDEYLNFFPLVEYCYHNRFKEPAPDVIEFGVYNNKIKYFLPGMTKQEVKDIKQLLMNLAKMNGVDHHTETIQDYLTFRINDFTEEPYDKYYKALICIFN